jgi:hypothetical protein
VRVGWIERVSLPDFGLKGVEAKIDTGARTSALHISAAQPLALAAAGGKGHPDRLQVVLMGVGLSAKRRTIELEVEDWVMVRDTSGRRQRRPVIRTVLQLGKTRRTIRLGLTDRGDMRYPLLIGRTALPEGTLVDPHTRFLLGPSLAAGSNLPAPTSPGRRRLGGKS